MDCLDPPLEAPPEGTWCYPQCANVQVTEASKVNLDLPSLCDSQQAKETPEMQIDPVLQPNVEPEVDPALMEREPSIAASSVVAETTQVSRTPQKPRHTLRDKNGKLRLSTIIDSDEEIEVVDESAIISASTRSRLSCARTRQLTGEEE